VSTDDAIKLAVVILTSLTTAIGVIFKKVMDNCDACQQELNRYRTANDEALAAYRKRDEELWRFGNPSSDRRMP
jgi:hypothetical protein